MSKPATKEQLQKRREHPPQWYIDQIVDLMCRGSWIRGLSRRQLAEKWGVGESTVATWAQFASKIVKAGTDEEVREEIKTTSIEQLQIFAAQSARARRFGEAAKTVRILNEVTGAINGGIGPVNVSIKLDVGGRDVEVTRGQFEEAWRHLVESWHRAAKAELSPEVAARLIARAGEEFKQLAEAET